MGVYACICVSHIIFLIASFQFIQIEFCRSNAHFITQRIFFYKNIHKIMATTMEGGWRKINTKERKSSAAEQTDDRKSFVQHGSRLRRSISSKLCERNLMSLMKWKFFFLAACDDATSMSMPICKYFFVISKKFPLKILESLSSLSSSQSGKFKLNCKLNRIFSISNSLNLSKCRFSFNISAK